MPWNEPGNNEKNPDPWGGRRQDNPPDLDKLLADFFKKIRSLFGGKKGPMRSSPSSGDASPHKGLFIGIAAAILFVLWFLSGLFIVNPAEEAVVLRFGKFHEVMHPGLHWFARFIDQKYLVDIQKIYTFSLQGDFLTKSSEQGDLPKQYIPVDTQKKLPGTSDQSKNLVNVELNVQYRISSARDYLFNVVNPDGTIQQVSEGALSDVIGTMKLDDVLTTGREVLSQGVFDRVTRTLNSYNLGLKVVAVTLKKVQAPDQVRGAFNDVNRADQDRATFIQQAQAYASKVVPLAQGRAARVLADAAGYQQQVVLAAQANIARYQALLKVYLAFPDITRERMYLETVQTILRNTTKVLVEGQGNNNLLYLPLDKLINQSSLKSNSDNSNTLSAAASNDFSSDSTNEASDNLTLSHSFMGLKSVEIKHDNS